jgi:GNAT superfamily N-acetyltransferase
MSFAIRRATPDDAMAIAQVRVTSWQATYRGAIPDSYLDAMRPETSVEMWRAAAAGETPGVEVLVGTLEDRIVGFAGYGPARPPAFDYSGELYTTYWLPEAMGKGYGSQMFREAVRGLLRLGHGDMLLWVLEANVRGRRFYESLVKGTLIPDSRKSFTLDDHEIWEVAYGFRPLDAFK